MTEILIFGRSGQVARELARAVPGALCLGRDMADLMVAGRAAAAIREATPALVINAAAYTAVDAAEDDEAAAMRLNAEAPAEMAEAAKALGIPFLTVSTDYVFDGSGDAPWREDAPIAPLNAYGRSKAAGEAAVAEIGGRYAILRTAWVFSAHGGNFVKTMLRLAETRDALSVVADQIGGPTAARDIAAALLTMGRAFCQGDGEDGGETGIYHFAGAPETSWAGFAREIFAQAGKNVTVTDIPASQYPTPATRPANSRLDCARIDRVFGVKQPDWRASLSDVVKDLGA